MSRPNYFIFLKKIVFTWSDIFYFYVNARYWQSRCGKLDSGRDNKLQVHVYGAVMTNE